MSWLLIAVLRVGPGSSLPFTASANHPPCLARTRVCRVCVLVMCVWNEVCVCRSVLSALAYDDPVYLPLRALWHHARSDRGGVLDHISLTLLCSSVVR